MMGAPDPWSLLNRKPADRDLGSVSE